MAHTAWPYQYAGMNIQIILKMSLYLFFFERNDSLPCDVFYEDYLKDFWEFVCFGRSKINIRNNH